MRSHNPNRSVNRRRFLALSAGVTAVGVAGCTDGVNNSDSDSTAPFSLLITDAPADIGDFESLNVTFDHARVFLADAVEDEEGGDEDAVEDEDGEDNRSWFVLDIAGETVDLTDVVGDVADPVFEGELEEGTYSKVELHVDSVDATLTDGESANVNVPSEKLQLTSAFEVVAEEPLEFVFDINVVQRGPGAEYNLLPVIDGSGINGEDVDVERRDEAATGDDGGANGDEESGDNGESEDEEPGEGRDNGPPDDQGGE